MPNGKGTIMCCYCKHVTWGPTYRCNLHDIDLPVEQYGSMNLLCLDFQEGPHLEPMIFMKSQYNELAPHMHKGKLYAFPYPSHHCAADLKEVMVLEE